MRSMKYLAVLSMCQFLIPTGAHGADPTGEFAIEGIGIQSCLDFAEARAANADTYMRYQGWLEGYLTAVNRYEPQTYDITPWETTELIALIVVNHCQQNPDERFFETVQKLTNTLRPGRLETSSAQVILSEGDRSVRVYEDVVRRAQTALANHGLYLSRVDGKFGPQTAEALALYQQDKGLEVTALPDPLTLWTLIRP